MAQSASCRVIGFIASTIINIPVLGKALVKLKRTVFGARKFPGSAEYWEQRYADGGNSGAGSYKELAEHKAEVINAFVVEKGIQTVIEFGCGDGNQLKLGRYPRYIGLDVSPTIIRKCIKAFEGDPTKSFFVYNSLGFQDNHGVFKADLAMSLDVLYHLVEDDVFNQYMHHLLNAASKYVLIYSSNYKKSQAYHEVDRVFTDWISENRSEWVLVRTIGNKFRADPQAPNHTSKADFYVFERMLSDHAEDFSSP